MESDCGDDTTIVGTSSSPVKISLLLDNTYPDTIIFSPLSLQPPSRILNPVDTNYHWPHPSSKTVSTSTSPAPAVRWIRSLDDLAQAPLAKRTRLNVESDPLEPTIPATHEVAHPDDDYDPDGSDGDFDGSVVEARLPGECEKRRGDKKSQKSNGAKRPVIWTQSLTLPPPSPNSLQLLTRLSTVLSEQTSVEALSVITHHLMQPFTEAPTDTLEWDDMSLTAVANRCCILKESEGIADYKLMLSYLQLVVTCDGQHKEARQKGLGSPSMEYFAKEAGIKYTKFQSWYSQGTRLVYLSAAATPFILLLLGNCDNQLRLDEIQVNFFRLPPPLTIWTSVYEQPCNAPIVTDLSAIHTLTEPQETSYDMCPVHTITFHFRIPTNRCPFNTAQAPEWTAVERSKAIEAVPVASLSELEERLNDFYNSMGKKKDPDSYLLIDTDICEGKTLFIQDKDARPVAILIPNMVANLPHLQSSVVSQLQSTWKGEFEDDHSDQDGYHYLSWHCDYYNRYTERSYDAPDDTSPYYTHKEGQTTVHFQRHAPGHSKEFLKDIGESDLLAEIFHDVMMFVNVNIRTLLPDVYKELTVFVDHLLLNDQSAAYPFSGYVINVGVATNGHRDGFDKIACVVVPFGDWQRGELCLYEAGYVWHLKPWDVLIFPLGHITHFNLHFSGLRGSLFLHSDSCGDSWSHNPPSNEATISSLVDSFEQFREHRNIEIDNQVILEEDRTRTPTPPIPATSDQPRPDIAYIRTEYHPSSGRDSREELLEEYQACEEKSKVDFDDLPWHPFESKIDFELAEFILQAALNEGEIDGLLKNIVQRGGELPSFQNHRELIALWEKAADLHTRFMKTIFSVPLRNQNYEFDVPEESQHRDKTYYADFKRAVWHKAFEIILSPIKNRSKIGAWVQSSDPDVAPWYLFPTIMILSADSEEQ
ncbi:hypothetical protein EDD85DRAFT_957670 [Armillaria nabsnona]|nr:hypothetical protein EDD85DRAFT_957670 [Armillaria nabsnona]